jgi:hypothetical protein
LPFFNAEGRGSGSRQDATRAPVTVEVSGTAAIAIKVPVSTGYFAMPESLEILVRWMPACRVPRAAVLP